MAMKLEAVKDFLLAQEVYLPSVRRNQKDPVPAVDSSTAKGKQRAKSPTVKTRAG
jgi:hypothetical protein